jgi:hypothetical protein
MKRKSARVERGFALLNGHVFRLRTLLRGRLQARRMRICKRAQADHGE